MIYLDNAATTLKKPPEVAAAVVKAMEDMGNAGRGGHGPALKAARCVYEARKRISALFHAGDPTRTAFTLNATQSLNMAIQGLFEAGDHCITTAAEHNSVLRPLHRMKRQGLDLSVIPVDGFGNICYDEMEKAVRPNTRGIVCTHMSNLTGNLTDLRRVGKISREHGLLFILDASQSAGVFPVDMEAMHIDVLCFTGHKSLMGPQGTGGICVREGLDIRPLLIGGSGVRSFEEVHPAQMPEALEAGTLNAHGIAGLNAALCFLEETGMDRIREKEQRLARQFYDGVKAIEGVKLYGDFGNMERGPVIALNIGDRDSGAAADELYEKYGICVRPGAHCAPLLHRALGTERQGAVRFSMSWFNTEKEMERAVRAVRCIAKG